MFISSLWTIRYNGLHTLSAKTKAKVVCIKNFCSSKWGITTKTTIWANYISLKHLLQTCNKVEIAYMCTVVQHEANSPYSHCPLSSPNRISEKSVKFYSHRLSEGNHTDPCSYKYNNMQAWSKLVPCGTDGRFLLCGFQALVTLTLTLDRVIRHTVVHQSSTSIYISNFIEIGKTFLWTDYPQGRLQVQGHVTQELGKIAKIWSDQI